MDEHQNKIKNLRDKSVLNSVIVSKNVPCLQLTIKTVFTGFVYCSIRIDFHAFEVLVLGLARRFL